jgi:biopolymer transport protein TolR
MKSDINVTPLIDVLLVLLIIFLVVAPVAPRALDASLPKPDPGPTKPPPPGLVLEVRADGFALNRTPVWEESDLADRLRAAFERRGDRTLFVRTTGEVSYRRVVEALDLARGAGAERIGMLDSEVEAEAETAPGVSPGRRTRGVGRVF